jgi:predicted proteasome-type protease
MKVGEFHKAVSVLLTERMRPLTTGQHVLNASACIEIYTLIFDTLVELVAESGNPLTNEAVNYLAQQYYDAVQVNGGQELDPNIFTQRAKAENIATKELVLLSIMLSGTDFALPVIAEIKKRS